MKTAIAILLAYAGIAVVALPTPDIDWSVYVKENKREANSAPDMDFNQFISEKRASASLVDKPSRKPLLARSAGTAVDLSGGAVSSGTRAELDAHADEIVPDATIYVKSAVAKADGVVDTAVERADGVVDTLSGTSVDVESKGSANIADNGNDGAGANVDLNTSTSGTY